MTKNGAHSKAVSRRRESSIRVLALALTQQYLCQARVVLEYSNASGD
jgi:hypothetical protein